jgi:hypothetical protein
MSFEILESPQQTVYAPLNTTIDADRDYYSLAGLDACACGGGAVRTQVQMGTSTPAAPQPNGVSGFYTHVPEGMYTPGLGDEGLPVLEAAEDGASRMLWYLAGVIGLWAFWAWRTPHEPMSER